MRLEESVEKFREIVESDRGAAVIFAGSDSDEPHILKITEGLTKYGIPFQVRIVSAHKEPERLMKIVREYDTFDGPLVYIAVAGAVDALSGILSFNSTRPTITCPPDHPNDSGIKNPAGSSNAYVGRPDNTARYAAQILSLVSRNYGEAVAQEAQKKRSSLLTADERFIAHFPPADTSKGVKK